MIRITGTRFIYVGEADDIMRRYRRHFNEWIWPNDASLTVLVEMPGATKKERQKMETMEMRRLRASGEFVLSAEASEAGRRNILKAHRERTPEQRKAISEKARTAVTMESRRKRAETMRVTLSKLPQGWRDEVNKKAWETRRLRYGAKGLKIKTRKPYGTGTNTNHSSVSN